MTFAQLAVAGAAAVLGPLLALPRGWRLPVTIGELLAGLALGHTGLRVLDATDPTFAFLADIGFALVMFVAGTHVPIRDPRLRPALRTGAVRAAVVGVLAVPLAMLIATLFKTGHFPLYAVLLASSSAALVLPAVDARDPAVLTLLPQVAIADTACIVALPLAIDPAHAARAGSGAVAVLGSAALLFLGLREAERRGWRRTLHKVSQRRKFALEMRLGLILLFALAALAVATHVSVMLAGFAFGLAVAAVGEPRRLARQLFALTEGFFGPLFFVWLGASLDVRSLGDHPRFALLGVVLGLGALVVHWAMRVGGQPLRSATLAAAQLGVPVAAATVGTRAHLLADGEPAALVLGALVTIGAVTVAVRGASPRTVSADATPPDAASAG
ncbi:cation:proton antiporter [Actinoplanes sp. HUAS TT8]|uniref:cation:proton antiporter n=1 Tax=Actinoplanes sp. HUAS TT8 TaxID=3447453 RepID=UPI003F5223C5